MTTSDDTSLRKTPQRIDELTRGDHPRLLPDDVIFYFGDYTARAGYDHSACNQLVFNIKKPMSYRESGQWYYKTKAIEDCAKLVASTVMNSLGQLTFVPIPPSKVKYDAGYDNRIVQMMSQVVSASGERAQILELVTQKVSRDAAHETGVRPTVDDLKANYELDASLLSQVRQNLIIVDDVLTNGTSFRAMSDTIKLALPEHSIFGLFIARTVHPPIDLLIFDD
jgi:hypothetical protein